MRAWDVEAPQSTAWSPPSGCRSTCSLGRGACGVCPGILC